MGATLSALAMGLLFGAGLIISGMTNPANVKGFLDVFGAWRPQLMAVLGMGMMVTWLLYVLARRFAHPLAAPVFHDGRWDHCRQGSRNNGKGFHQDHRQSGLCRRRSADR